jgi:hypothetical protein
MLNRKRMILIWIFYTLILVWLSFFIFCSNKKFKWPDFYYRQDSWTNCCDDSLIELKVLEILKLLSEFDEIFRKRNESC